MAEPGLSGRYGTLAGMSDRNTIQAGVRILVMSPDIRTGQRALVGSMIAKCRFVALPGQGDQIATANLTGVSASSTNIGMPLFLTIDRIEHYTNGPGDTDPEGWAVVLMDAPDAPESCLALVDALGERGWRIDGAIGSDHPFSAAVDTWKDSRL